MKNSVLRAATISALAAACVSPAPDALADTCMIDAYKVYAYAKQKTRLGFFCSGHGRTGGRTARFAADPASGLRCSGTSPGDTDKPISHRAELFATPGSSVGLPRKGWRVDGFKLTGGAFKTHDRRDSMILFDYQVPGGGAAFNYAVTSITFSKPGGRCADVLSDLFDVWKKQWHADDWRSK